MRFLAYYAFQLFSHGDTTANNHNINIVRGTFQEDIPHIPANHIALQTQLVCSCTDLVEDFLI